MSRIAALVESALKDAWAFHDLPWHVEVDPERGDGPAHSFFADGLPQYRAMRPRERHAFVFREACFHL